jgi:transcriptional regulator with XRE-family HTH domain
LPVYKVNYHDLGYEKRKKQRYVDKKQQHVCRKKDTIYYTYSEVKKMNFGIKLQALRKEKRISQEALAGQLNVSRQAVSKWETGEGYPEMETIIMISNLFGVTLDYLMKDNKEEEPLMSEDAITLSSVELEDFFRFKKRFAFIIALAVASIIVSVSLSVFFDDNNLAIGAMFLIVALAVGSMTMIGMMDAKYTYLDKKTILLKSSDLELMKEKQEKFNTIFPLLIAFGVFLIIAGLAVTVIFDDVSDFFAGIFLWMVATVIATFIYSGVLENTYRQICNNKSFVKEVKENEQNNKYYMITMPLAAMVYLLLGFVFDAWHPGWLVFPVTAIITFGITELKK